MLKKEIVNLINKGEKKEYRKFGVTVGVFLLIISAILFWLEKSSFHYFVYIGMFLFIFGLCRPVLLKPIYIGWMSFAIILGHVVTQVILILIYILIFTPIGLILRLLRKDLLNENFEKGIKTYWIKREIKSFDPHDAEKQY